MQVIATAYYDTNVKLVVNMNIFITKNPILNNNNKKINEFPINKI